MPTPDSTTRRTCCSTPDGVGGFITPIELRADVLAVSAQRLTASEGSSLWCADDHTFDVQVCSTPDGVGGFITWYRARSFESKGLLNA